MGVTFTSNRVTYRLALSYESARMLREAMGLLPEDRRRSPLFKSLTRDLDRSITMMERTIKNEKLVQEERRKRYASRKKDGRPRTDGKV